MFEALKLLELADESRLPARNLSASFLWSRRYIGVRRASNMPISSLMTLRVSVLWLMLFVRPKPTLVWLWDSSLLLPNKKLSKPSLILLIEPKPPPLRRDPIVPLQPTPDVRASLMGWWGRVGQIVGKWSNFLPGFDAYGCLTSGEEDIDKLLPPDGLCPANWGSRFDPPTLELCEGNEMKLFVSWSWRIYDYY